MDEAAVAAHPAPVASVASATPVPIRSLVEGWLAYSSRQLKPRVRITYGANVERFLTFLGDVAFQNVSETDLWRFIDAEMAICGNLRTLNIERIRGFRCEAGVFGRTPKPPATCGPGCPTYVGRNPSVVGHALKGINSFLRYAMRRGHLARNPAQDVAREFARDYPIAKFLRRRRQPTVQDVKTLIMGTLHPARKAVYMTLAKTGFRVHELVALTVDETCLDVEAKTIRIPLPGEDQPGKRRGKRLGFIDEELGEVLREYLDYRRGLLARRPPERQPKQLFLGDNGRPVTPAHIKDRKSVV